MVYMIPSECGSVHISEAGRPIQAKIREQERDIRLTCTFAIPLMKVKVHLLLFNWQIVNNIPSLNKNALICVLSKVFFVSILIALCYLLLLVLPLRMQILLTRHALLSFSEFALLFCF